MTARWRDVLSALAALVLAFGAVQLFAGAQDVGITTDEPAHTERLASWMQTGWYLPAPELRDGEPDSRKGVLSSPFVYGPAFSLTAHTANIAVGNEGRGQIAFTRAGWTVRHLTVAALALIAALAVGAATWVLTGSWRFGLWAAAALLAIPAWMGQGFFNPKDVPAAAGYTLVTVALLLALWRPQRESRRWLRPVAITALLAGGVFIGAGTRLSLWAPYFASILTYVVLRVGQQRLGGIARNRAPDWAVLGGGLLGVMAIAVAYPKAAATPVSLLVDSVSGAAGYPNYSATLTAGELLSYQPPVWYLPAHVFAVTPLLLLALALGGAAFGIRALWRAWSGRLGGATFWRRDDLGLLLVVQQAALLPLLAVLGGAVMYDGVRQHLYVIPALAILAGVGAARFASWADRGYRLRLRRVFAGLVLTLALAVPMAEQTILYPYNYTYVNPAAGIRGAQDNWETDYWQASWREALGRIPSNVKFRCSYSLIAPDEPADVRLDAGTCPSWHLDPFSGERGTESDADPARETPALWAIAIKRGRNTPPSTCEQVSDVTRWLRGERVTMSYVLRCPFRTAASRPLR